MLDQQDGPRMLYLLEQICLFVLRHEIGNVVGHRWQPSNALLLDIHQSRNLMADYPDLLVLDRELDIRNKSR